MPKIKFSKLAYKRRYCDMCGVKLSREEAIICEECLQQNGGVKHD